MDEDGRIYSPEASDGKTDWPTKIAFTVIAILALIIIDVVLVLTR